MKKILSIALLAVIVTGCGVFNRSATTPGSTRPQLKFIPAEFHDLHLGMSLRDALKARPGLQFVEQDYDFRKVYIEEIGRDGIKTAVYYFDDDGDQPLYEIMMIYPSAEERDAVAFKLMGEPNFEDSEWMHDSQEGFRIHAWTFKEKFIIVGKIEGTEWEEEK